MEYPTLLPRFLKYVKINSRSDEHADRFPSTQREVDYQMVIMKELEELGLSDVHYNEKAGTVIATIPSNVDWDVPVMGFLAHCDTADFNSENVKPQITENYDGESKIQLGDSEFYLDPAVFPNLKKYKGQTIISASGDTLLGGDDKCGDAELVTFAEYLLAHPEIKHGEIRLGFTPDEEIGTGAQHFDVEDFNAAFAFTVDGEGPGKLDWGTFSAAQFELDIQGVNVHPAVAKGQMINAIQVGIDFQNSLPQDEVPEKTEGEEGFYHLMDFSGTVDNAHLAYIIRDFKRDGLEARKNLVKEKVAELNAKYGERIKLKMWDQYYNMADELAKHMEIIDLARDAYRACGLTEINEEPVRGGTDGSQLTYMGLPCPNLFAGEENMHGRYEYTVLESMWKAVDVMIKMAELQAERNK
ncbi:peptidase T [Lactobacillus delbrueckii subsp. lactis]|jgi:tripeptide aminopeptidase|uniref:Peptidase T n=3 Tax=Lactobacillus delbrueckii TaxID=1584 RepID=A0A381KYM3_LACDL|nr:peptidase T [Lactobacillus delbrueckii]CAH1706076.1 Peptidase T [Lactobacillus delbrueckii subsp. delbrueckii]ABJ58668.1 peptidase T, Metallo peptidase, MEROPS family M20B [Lactobacillus delbrueckii subsp. bulgaricus ATCC BAA-365]ADQ61138.1 Peptidase T, Metallo peptidase, MEROPS family M20B [Lactobacillus delbrueckii subsp. bulgaricus ND02]ASW12112.1 peptidase T [Lactobacillus delbrueckii subsp. lactis DSM 20072]AZA16054.1 MAG: peptidase T [Lactobacillus delbrueckii subsp. lactis]